MSNFPYVLIPKAIFDGVDNGSITPEQFDVFCYCYLRAERPAYQVHGYSAANICHFRRLDADQANVKRYRRAALDLLDRDLLRRDYHKVDTTRSDATARPYNVWVPNPDRFGVIGTLEENRVSLWSARVPLVVPDNVPVPTCVTDSKENTSADEQRDIVPVSVPLNHNIVSISNQENPKTIEKDPLNLPSGDFSPAPLPPGGDAQAAGLLNPHRESKAKAAGKESSLNEKQCDQLQNVALLYADFATWLSLRQFSPDVDHVRALLRDFHPVELLLAQTSRFGLGNEALKKSMAQFFYKSARPAIEAARLKVTPVPPPRSKYGLDETFDIKELVRREFGDDYAKELRPRWGAVIAAWNKYKGNTTAVSATQTTGVNA
jgi:hypothetical protein